jgi:hypothetical protein
MVPPIRRRLLQSLRLDIVGRTGKEEAGKAEARKTEAGKAGDRKSEKHER